MDAINHHFFSGRSLPRDVWRPSFNVCHQTTSYDRSPGVPGAVFINYFGSQGSVFQRLLIGLQLTMREAVRGYLRPSFNVCHQTTFDDRSPGVPGAVLINYFGSQGCVASVKEVDLEKHGQLRHGPLIQLTRNITVPSITIN
ncbi:hypothetical protein CEXT_214291 [Caerostris extrusa]|uniref:Uncharacterized protein n=1 Tax=Caerostris extrusa TaxID=172846 RepID=A0AAV4N632_CAEEX|nr:hypothetical protein CEXT_214291 [Caerostris extrusa]